MSDEFSDILSGDLCGGIMNKSNKFTVKKLKLACSNANNKKILENA